MCPFPLLNALHRPILRSPRPRGRLRSPHRRGAAAEDSPARRRDANPRGAGDARRGGADDERDLRAEELGDLRGARRPRFRLRDGRGLAFPLQFPQADERLRRGLPAHPDEDRVARAARHPAGGEGIWRPARRARARHRPHRFRQIDDAGRADRLHQQQLLAAHRHHRGADRVRAQQQAQHHHAARGAGALVDFPGGAEGRAARGCRHRARR